MAYELTNKKVASLVGVDFTGNIIPTTRYSWIKRDTSWFSNGKGNVVVDIIAINILAEILYRYRPAVLRSEDLKEEIIRQKFSGDLLQKNYKQISEKFGITEKQVRDGMTTLERNGLIERIFIDKCYGAGIIRNIIYIDINIEKVKDISSRLPEDKDFEGGYCLISQYVVTKSVTRGNELGAHTKITTESSSENLLSKDNTPNGDETVEIENPIINNKANNKEEIQGDTNVHTTVQATLLDHRAKLDKFFKEDITDEQIEEEAATERWMGTLGEKGYENEYEHVEKAIEQVAVKKATIKKEGKIANWKISSFCKSEAKKHGVSCVARDNKGVQHFNSKVFKELMEIAGCDDIFCMIGKLIEGNIKLGQYSYDISTPQNLYSNSSRIYNACVKNGYWESSTNPTTQRFEEFYAIYPKREGYAEAKEWYAINVRKKEKHDEIMQGTKEFVKKVGKEQKDITFLPSANTYLVKERWYDTLPDKLQDDDVVYERAYESGDPEILREHLKLKYGEDFSKREELDHVCIYWQEKKTAIECKNQTPII